ncbi:MAG TPA: NAD-dependent epimerase/dehydratase family protein, partial [Dehalococcoidales bacterium]|nr:NAD-dependent epimerase/dehydratase family protein [Dehalococcoidales bacterium]
MSILITGGTGFLGAGLARKLLKQDENVVLFDVFPRMERVSDIKDKVKVVQGDLKVWPEVLNAVKDNKVEGIFHLGAMLSLPSEDNPWASFQTNVAGTMYILEAARLFGVK